MTKNHHRGNQPSATWRETSPPGLVAELADALDLKSSFARSVGSSPTGATTQNIPIISTHRKSPRMKLNQNTMLAKQAVTGEINKLNLHPDAHIGVAVSGGADSTALMFILSLIYKGTKASQVHVVNIDHQLQEVTNSVAGDVAKLAEQFEFNVHLLKVEVDSTVSSVEEAARNARYKAFESIIETHNLEAFLIGHTKNDQAEQVLLGLLRGSGTRSLAGMPQTRGVYVRPFLNHIGRKETENICQGNNITFWEDPHNKSSEYNRVNIRTIIDDIQNQTGQNIVNALVKTALINKEEADTVDFYAEQAYPEVRNNGWKVTHLEEYPVAVRKRLYRYQLLSMNVPNVKITFNALNQVEQLITNWNGQTVENISKGVLVTRRNGSLIFTTNS